MKCSNQPLVYARTGGACIYIASGTYTTSKNLIIPSNTQIFGDGMNQTVIQATSDFADDKLIGNKIESENISYNIAIFDIGLKGSGYDSKKDTDGIAFANIKDSFIIGVKAENFKRDGIYLGYYKKTGEDSVPIERGTNNVRVSHSKLINNGRNGLSLIHGRENIIDQNQVNSNNQIKPGKVGIGGIVLEPDQDLQVTDNKVIDNTTDSNKYHGIFLQGCAASNVKVSSNAVCENNAHGNQAPYQNREKNIIECKGSNNFFVNNDLEIDPSQLGDGSKVGPQYKNNCGSLANLPKNPNISSDFTRVLTRRLVNSIKINSTNWNFKSDEFYTYKLPGKQGKPNLFTLPIEIVYFDGEPDLFVLNFNYLNAAPPSGSGIPSTNSCDFERAKKNSSDSYCPFGRIEKCIGSLLKNKCKNLSSCQDLRCIDYDECQFEKTKSNSSDKYCPFGRIEQCMGGKKTGSSKCEENKYIDKNCQDLKCVDYEECIYPQERPDSADEHCKVNRIEECTGGRKDSSKSCKYNQFIDTNCKDVRCVDWEDCEYAEDAGEPDDECPNGYVQTCHGVKKEGESDCKYNDFTDPECFDKRCK